MWESAAWADLRSARRPRTPLGRSGGPYHVTTPFYFLSRDVKTTKCNQYLPVFLTSLNVSDSRFRKLVMFWMWRHHDMELWRHGGGAWHNGLILTTASNANRLADVANHVTRLWQAVIRKIANAGSRASYGPYHGLKMPNHGINILDGWFKEIKFKSHHLLRYPVAILNKLLC